MTIQGWIFMTLSVGFVCGLMAWCAWKILQEKPRSPGSSPRPRK